MTTLSSRYSQNANVASAITVDTTNFNNNLDSSDNDVQIALETIDELSISSGTDPNAIHDNVAGEINAITEKTTPVAGDKLVIEDSADGFTKKSIPISALPTTGGTDGDAVHVNVAGEIAAITEKAIPARTDKIIAENSEDANAKVYIELGNIPGVISGDVIPFSTASVSWNNGVMGSSASQFSSDGAIKAVIDTKQNILTEGAFVDGDKTKLDGIATGAEANVNSDWDADSGDAQILNKPTIPSAVSDLTNDSNFITPSSITYETLNTNGDVGTSVGQLAIGNHVHSGVYEPADADIVADASYVHTDNNYTNAEKTKVGYLTVTKNVDLDSIGTDPNAIHDNVAGEINVITEKATPVAGDMIVIEDSEDSHNKKMVVIGNIPGVISGDVIPFSTASISWNNASIMGSSASQFSSDGAIRAVVAMKANVLQLDNTTSFTPDADYEPATKKYVDDNAGGGGLTWSLISSNTNAAVDNGYLIDASSGNVTLTLPASPAEGDTIGWVDAKDSATTNTITIGRNSENIFGIAEDLTVDINGAGAQIVYVDEATGWQIVTEINKGEAGRQASVWVDAGAFISQSTDGMTKGQTELPTNKVMINFALGAVDGTDTNYGTQFKIVMPSNIKMSEGIKYKLHWGSSTTAGIGDAVFGVALLTAGHSGPLDTPFSTAVTVTSTFITEVANHITPESTAISLGSAAKGDLIIGKITIIPDDASWTYTEDVQILGLDLIYTAE